MGCDNCPKAEKDRSVDKRGNTISTKSDLENYEERLYGKNPAMKKNKSINKMSYPEYVEEKKAQRDYARKLGDRAVENFPDDYKRIQVAELIAIYNHEEVSKLTPGQALVALWEFVHHSAYQKVISEFEGLSEEVDIKYNDLMSKKIKAKWKP